MAHLSKSMMGKLNSAHDLTQGERSYLKEQGISPLAFDAMSREEQDDWKEEMKEPAYEHMRNWEQKEGRDWAAHRRDLRLKKSL